MSMPMAQLWKRGAALAASLPGGAGALRRLRGRLLAIPMYHGVVTEPLPVFNWCQLDISRFEEEIKFLASEYRVLPLREVVSRLRGGHPLPERTAVITFDDGYRSVCANAFPILERYQLPFTVFLITGLVGTGELVWPDRLFVSLQATRVRTISLGEACWPIEDSVQRACAYRGICARLKKMPTEEKDEALNKLLAQLEPAPVAVSSFALANWEEIGRLARSPLAHFGSHTHTHPILARCQPERQRGELAQSRDILRDRLGIADMFAYPNGTTEDFTSVTKSLTRELEYSCALTTIPGLNSAAHDLYELRRVNVGADDTLPQFERLMLGV